MSYSPVIRIAKNSERGYSFYAGWAPDFRGIFQADSIGYFEILGEEEISRISKYAKQLGIVPIMIGLTSQEKARIAENLRSKGLEIEVTKP